MTVGRWRRQLSRAHPKVLRILIAAVVAAINMIGAAAAPLICWYVIPRPPIDHAVDLLVDNLWLAVCYAVVAAIVGVIVGVRMAATSLRWVTERRRPNTPERLMVLSVPRRVAELEMAFWGAAALAFGVFNALHGILIGLGVAGVVLADGLIVSSISYLMIERLQRPIVRRVLRSGLPERIGMRLGIRTFLAWFLGSGVVLVGIGAIGAAVLVVGPVVGVTRLAISMLVLASIGLLLGGFMIVLALRAISEPIRAMRDNVRRAQQGDLNQHIPIYDGTEIGVLQAGFNEMLAGLRERERIHDLFGRHVGPDVAEAALERGVQLGGEVRHVGALFVDIVGSTEIAYGRPPQEVVALLNRFFAVVIEVVHAHGGLINKFEGDAALAIWGAPADDPDLEASIVRAARVLAERLEDEIPEISAGIGVSAGPAVAGNVGARERYEYTVIGDPVNEAARLSDRAKKTPTKVLVRADLLDGIGGEAARWRTRKAVRLRGRSDATPVVTTRV